jgi:2-iminobutanoate/2-iminopropanoate deaminase
MRKQKSNRRSFLRGSLAGAATMGATAMALSATAAPGKPAAQKKVVNIPGIPPTLTGMFSSATQLGNLLFVSGQGAADPATHQIAPGPISNQVKQCLENLKAVLEAAGSSMDKVLKCTVFLTDIADFQAMNAVYHSYFTSNPPARTTLAVKNLPLATPVEIECIACV